TALAAAKSITDLAGAPTFVKRQKAEMFTALGVTLPAIGIYIPRAWTQAKSQTQRDTRCQCVLDWYARNADPVLLAKQTELAVEALLRSVDRLTTATGGVYGGAQLEESAVVEVTDGFDKSIEPAYDRRATLTFPVYDRD